MPVATILAIISTIIQDTPQAVALFQEASAFLQPGAADPTPAQWASLVTAMAAAHSKVQTAPLA